MLLQSAIPVFQRYRLSTVDGVDTPVGALAMLYFQEPTPQGDGPLVQAAGGVRKDIDGPMITRLAQQGDPGAQELIAEIGTWLGAGVASIAALLDPEIVVVGGGVVAAGDLLLEPARAAYSQHLTADPYEDTPEQVIGRIAIPAIGLDPDTDLPVVPVRLHARSWHTYPEPDPAARHNVLLLHGEVEGVLRAPVSADRATKVLRRMVEHGDIAPTRVRAVGYAPHHFQRLSQPLLHPLDHPAGLLGAMARRKPMLYTPRIWALVMLVIRLLPRFVMRKIGF